MRAAKASENVRSSVNAEKHACALVLVADPTPGFFKASERGRIQHTLMHEETIQMPTVSRLRWLKPFDYRTFGREPNYGILQ